MRSPSSLFAGFPAFKKPMCKSIFGLKVVYVALRLVHLSMIDWHSFLQVNLLPLRSLRGPPTSPVLSPVMIPVLQSGSSFTRERMDKVAPEEDSTCSNVKVECLCKQREWLGLDSRLTKSWSWLNTNCHTVTTLPSLISCSVYLCYKLNVQY